MLKKIIKPFQEVLLARRLCVGCTGSLDNCKKLGNLSDRRILMQCKCKRRYVFDKEMGKYQRASFMEEQEILRQLAKERD